MFRSLRSRLILSYVLLILLTLCVAGGGLLVFIQPYESARLTQRLVAELGPAALQARGMMADGDTPAAIVDNLHGQLEDQSWRVVWIDDQRTVLADSGHQWVGRTLPSTVQAVVNVNPRRFLTGRLQMNGRTFVYSGVSGTTRQGDARGSLLLLATPRPFLGAIEDLAGPLTGAALVALVVAVVTGWLLARSISSPINRLTQATEQIAKGNFDEPIAVAGGDEVSRLGKSFNAMTRAVRRSQQVQKDFVANMSHEFKTPLTSVQGFAQAIMDGTIRDMEGARNAARLIFEESQRMGRMVGDLLTLARLDAGDIPMEHERLDLAAMLPTWVERFRSRAEKEGMALTLAVDSPPPVEGDAGRLEQAVANLIDNAIKYNQAGGRVEVTAVAAHGERAKTGRDGAGPTDWAVICVKDTGTGIPAVHLPRLTERFYRVEKARVAGGSGLGLAIVQQIAQAHGGRLEIQSEEGKGTTVSIWLPTVAAKSTNRV